MKIPTKLLSLCCIPIRHIIVLIRSTIDRQTTPLIGAPLYLHTIKWMQNFYCVFYKVSILWNWFIRITILQANYFVLFYFGDQNIDLKLSEINILASSTGFARMNIQFYPKWTIFRHKNSLSLESSIAWRLICLRAKF